MPQPTDTLDLDLDGNFVQSATQWLETIAGRENWSLAVTFALTISLDEALTNIVSHAFPTANPVDSNHRTDGHSTPCTIRLRCTSFPTLVRIKIIDNGQPYDPTQAITPPLAGSVEQAQLGGHGLRLMRHYLSRMSYRRHDKENHLTLTLNVPPHVIPVTA